MSINKKSILDNYRVLAEFSIELYDEKENCYMFYGNSRGFDIHIFDEAGKRKQHIEMPVMIIGKDSFASAVVNYMVSNKLDLHYKELVEEL